MKVLHNRIVEHYTLDGKEQPIIVKPKLGDTSGMALGKTYYYLHASKAEQMTTAEIENNANWQQAKVVGIEVGIILRTVK